MTGVLLVLPLLALAGCSPQSALPRLAATPTPSTTTASPAEATVDVPLGLMWPIFPDGVPPTAAQVAVGKALFFDGVLSKDGSVSCASCHAREAGFADPRPVSLGVAGTHGTRNSASILNAAFFEHFGWAGEHASLEEQALAAITNPAEMALTADAIPSAVKEKYGAELQAAFGAVTAETAVAALAAYQRTLLVGDAPFDRYIYLKEESAVSESAKRGFAIFLKEARCVQCHFMRSEASHPFGGNTGFYTDGRFHNIGVGFNERGQTSDWGRYEITKDPEDRGAFKTPTLRNVERTPPYMHDGSLKTLEDVVDHYNKGGVPNANLDPDVKPLNLADQAKIDLVAFMKSLTSTLPDAPSR